MIEITELKEEDKGRAVKYKSTAMADKYQYGTITSWNDTYIFVDYYGTGRGTATRPIHLEFAEVEISVNREGKLIVKTLTGEIIK
jgi:hypothetical protein